MSEAIHRLPYMPSWHAHRPIYNTFD